MVVDENILKELEDFFKKTSLPDRVTIAPGSVIIDVRKFIEAQFSRARAEGSSPVRRLSVERLQILRSLLENHK
jgi:hypothetical protein